MLNKKLMAGLMVLAASLNHISCKEAKDGEDGVMHLVKIDDISASKPECINGARRYTNYRDANRNGTYDAGEEVGTPIESCDSVSVGSPIGRSIGPDCDPAMIVDGQATFPMTVGHHPVSSSRIQAKVPGFIDYNTSKVIKLVPDENLFVCEDGKKVLANEFRIGTIGTEKVKFDIVFIVDNSDSMKHNWTAIKTQLGAYVNQLNEKQVDYKIALVGYNEEANITGAINLGNDAALLAFLEEYGGSQKNGEYQKFIGKDRSGNDLGYFEAHLNTENGIPSIMYARDRMSFRTNAQRMYINVTNEFLVDDTPKVVTPPPAPAPAPTPAPTLAEDDVPFVPDSTTVYTPEKFCPTWKATDGFIHTIWMGDVFTKDGDRDGEPSTDAKGEYIPQPFDSNGGKFPPTVLTAPNCGKGIRQVMQHSYEGNPPFENPAPKQAAIPELDFTKLLVTDALLETSMVIFKTLEPKATHKLQIFIKDAEGAFIKGEFEGIYPELK